MNGKHQVKYLIFLYHQTMGRISDHKPILYMVRSSFISHLNNSGSVDYTSHDMLTDVIITNLQTYMYMYIHIDLN